MAFQTSLVLLTDASVKCGWFPWKNAIFFYFLSSFDPMEDQLKPKKRLLSLEKVKYFLVCLRIAGIRVMIKRKTCLWWIRGWNSCKRNKWEWWSMLTRLVTTFLLPNDKVLLPLDRVTSYYFCLIYSWCHHQSDSPVSDCFLFPFPLLSTPLITNICLTYTSYLRLCFRSYT